MFLNILKDILQLKTRLYNKKAVTKAKLEVVCIKIANEFAKKPAISCQIYIQPRPNFMNCFFWFVDFQNKNKQN